MNTETLKKLAEAMGYETETHGIHGVELVECDEHGVSHVAWFNPAKNPAQLLEVEEGFDIAVFPIWHETKKLWGAQASPIYGQDNYPILNNAVISESRTEAIMQAAEQEIG